VTQAVRAPRPGPAPPEPALFLERFRRFGGAPSVETYLALFHPEARLYDEGMPRPIGVSEIPAHIAGVLALIRGFRMRPERWRTRGARIFVEAYNQGELAGAPVSWRAVYRIELDGSQVSDGRRYFDRAPLLARIDPGLPVLDLMPRVEDAAPVTGAVAGSDAGPEALVEASARAWREGRPEAVAELFREDAALLAPGLPRPLGRAEIPAFYRRLAGLLGGARLVPRCWAGDGTLLFVEWQATVPTPGGDYALGLVERFDLAAGRVLAARTYFESAALARALHG
jgi:limonene-1,2-epoxide hydrolase